MSDKLVAVPGQQLTAAQQRQRKALARQFRMALRLAIVDPSYLEELMRVGAVVSGRRIIEGGLEDDPETGAELQRALMKISRRIQAEVRAEVRK